MFLEGAPVTVKNSMHKTVTLSVTEAELMAGFTCVQDMLYTRKVFDSLQLKVKLPMLFEMDNKGAVDLANNWAVGGRARHIETRQLFLRELKEEGVLSIKWNSGEENPSNMFTKTLPGPLFRKHIETFCED